MTISTIATSPVSGTEHHQPRPGWWTRRQQERRLRFRDQTSARLAELNQIAYLLNYAADLVRAGWLQHRWFAYLDDSGQLRTANVDSAREVADRPVVEVCLVGAIVQAAGGPSQLGTHTVRCAVELTWRTLFRPPSEMISRTPTPARTKHVRDLTRWNDHPGRTARDAEDLLRRSGAAAKSEAAHLRLESVGATPHASDARSPA
jgi:hypothetical protein